MTDYKKLSENAFNIQAKTYDTDKNGKHARNLYQDIIKALSSLQFSNVLDVGCGTGEVLSIIRKLYPTALLYGIDISEEMLKKAEEKKIDNLNLYLGDAEHLPFENARFDVLICTDSFHHYPKPQKAVSEFYRVLDNDGYLLLADFVKPFPIRQIMNIFLPFSNEGDVKIYSQNEILSFLRHSGFQDIQYRKINKSSYLVMAKNDLKDSFRFLRHEKPIFISVIILVCIFNLVLSAVLIVGLPILISEVLGMSDTLYGFSQASLSLGGLCGGFLTAIVAEKLKLKNLYVLLLICSASVFLMGISLLLGLPEIISYWVITLMCFVAMGVSTLFVVQIYTVVQMQTPPELVGKIMATLVSVAMCGQPIGQMIYGILFDVFSENAWIVMLIASIASILITWYSRQVFKQLEY